MKPKHIISAFALAGLLGLGVAGGLAANEAVETKAATEETTFYIDISASIWGSGNISNVSVYAWGGSDPSSTYIYASGSNDGKGALTQVTVEGTTYLSFDMSSRDYTGCLVYCWNMDKNGNKSADISFSSFTEGQNLITLASGGNWETLNSVTFGTLEVSAIHTVTKYGVYNGLKAEDSIGSDSVSDGDTYAIPGRINATGYHFGGWFTNEACTVAYAAQTINADLSIYAKYTTLVADSYIYYMTGAESVTTDYIYSFGGDCQFGGWKGTLITAVDGVEEVHGVLTFNATPQYIYKIPYSTTAEDSNVIFASDSSQSADLVLTPGCAYTFGGVAAGYADMATAFEFLLSAENVRNAVTADAKKKILAYSVCGISASDAATLYAAYSALNKDAKTYVDHSFAYTYNGAYDGVNTPSNDNISYETIMQQLYAIGVAGGTIAAAQAIVNNDTTAQSTITVITLVSLGVLATAGIFYSRKKHLAR